MNPSPDPPADRTSHFVQALDQVRGLDYDLSLAIAYDHDTHLALTPARDIHQTLRAVLGHAQDISRARMVAACLGCSPDPDEALASAREVADGHDTNVAVADSPKLLSLLLYLLEAIRPRTGQDTGPVKAGNVNRLALWLASASARLLPTAYRWRYLAEYSAEMAELPRQEQLAYAIRAASRTLPLRRGLTAASHRMPARETATVRHSP